MNQMMTVQQLNNRLRRVEAEIVAIRQGLAAVSQGESESDELAAANTFGWVNKTILREQMKQFFLMLPLHDVSAGIESHQQDMAEAGLLTNELSRSIITAREE